MLRNSSLVLKQGRQEHTRTDLGCGKPRSTQVCEPWAQVHRAAMSWQTGQVWAAPGDETAARHLPMPGQRLGTQPHTQGRTAKRSNISFSFTHQSRSTCVGLKDEKRKRDKLIKDSETQRLSLTFSSRLPGVFSLLAKCFMLPTNQILRCLRNPSFAGQVPDGHSPAAPTGHTYPPPAARVSLVKTNEGFNPENISFLKQMNPLDQSADERVLFKRFLEGTELY